MVLLSKNKLDFKDRTVATSRKSDPIYPLWKRCTMVVSRLTHSISPTIAHNRLGSAFDVWEDVHDLFEQGNVFRLFDLQEDI